jgi:hypothetical protein
MIPLLSPAQTIRDQIDRPYVAFFEKADPSFSQHDIRSLQSTLEREKDQRVLACQNEQKHLKTELESARAGLNSLNGSSAHDTLPASSARARLHAQISALEKLIRDKDRECSQTLPSTFEAELAKVHLLDSWPQQREHNIRVLETGNPRRRKHGDVDDIGYRKLAEGQDKDVDIGRQALRQMTSTGQLPAEIQDDALRGYVQDLAARIAKNSDLKIPLQVRVLENPDANSIALPGGILLVSSGLVLACATESELAAVLSQQIAHIAARHATRASKRWMFSKILVPVTQVATGLLTGGVSNAGAYYGMNYGFQGLGMLVDRTVASSNGKAQIEADQLGIQYLWNAGFDPKGFVAFLDTMTRDKNLSHSQSFLLTKPPLGERLVAAFSEIQLLPPKENYIVDSAEFQNIKRRLQSGIIGASEVRQQR